MQQLWDWFLEPTNQRLCLSLLVGLILGGLAGRLLSYRKERRTRSLRRESDKAFFKGIQYILSNDHDQAIEEFTKSVQINSDTIETYVALGNLYRSKGDIDRAIRIRQSIILRPNIDEAVAMAFDGTVSAIVTNPIQKEALYAAGFRHQGHTDYLAHLSARHGHAVQEVMMLVADGGLDTMAVV